MLGTGVSPPSRRSCTRWLASAVFFAAFAISGPVAADALKIRAALLYRFATFTTWPESAFGDKSEPACFAIVEDSALADALREIVKTKRLHGRAIDIVGLSRRKARHHCQVVYFGNTASKRISPGAIPDPILTVGTADSFLERGGMIYLFREGNKFKFSVSRQAVKRANLRLSSKLLRFAKEVID